MQELTYLLQNFFTHKDFLPPADKLAGTLFTPLHFVFSAAVLCGILLLSSYLSKKSEKTIRTVFTAIWLFALVFETAKIVWETYAGKTVDFEAAGILPLYPCSIFLYAMPLVIWGGDRLRYMGCGYVCSLGLLGATINFVYPANVLSNYSCISFAGMHTFFFHGVMLLTAIVLLRSGYHSYTRAKAPADLLLPAVPALAVSVIANIVNFSRIDSDYMFFKLESFFFAPIGKATPDWFSVVLVYGLYLLIHALPYLPSYVSNRKNHRHA